MTNEETNEYRRLEELGGSDYEIADGEPNIKGWDIKDNLGVKLGEVDELLFNPSTRKVRYVVADLDDSVFGSEDRKVLIPIGLAELHETDDEVFLPAVTLTQLGAAPLYVKGELTPEAEVAILDAYRGDLSLPVVYDEQTFYEHDHYNERNFYGRRFPDRGRTE